MINDRQVKKPRMDLNGGMTLAKAAVRRETSISFASFAPLREAFCLWANASR